jgi:sarcosine oxidase subunit delta
MLLIPCPFCGPRPEDEFAYGGDATLVTPKEENNVEAIADYIFLRDNPRGWHKEFWTHRYGCRRWMIVERHTVTHKIKSVSLATSTSQ